MKLWQRKRFLFPPQYDVEIQMKEDGKKQIGANIKYMHYSADVCVCLPLGEVAMENI